LEAGGGGKTGWRKAEGGGKTVRSRGAGKGKKKQRSGNGAATTKKKRICAMFGRRRKTNFCAGRKRNHKPASNSRKKGWMKIARRLVSIPSRKTKKTGSNVRDKRTTKKNPCSS